MEYRNYEGYEDLRDTLERALEQAAAGKGSERHGNGLPWAKQPIFTVAQAHGPGFLLGQAQKKTMEAGGMLRRDETDAAVRELLGAINYLAAAVQFVEEAEAGQQRVRVVVEATDSGAVDHEAVSLRRLREHAEANHARGARADTLFS